jgi:Tfp pilus assembly protein PilF
MVPIDGFDELMLEVGNRLQFGLLDDEIEKQAKNRAKAYREQFEKLVKPGEPPLASESAKDVRRAVERLVETQSGWWGWELKARAEPDPEKREQIYRSGLKEFRKNPELMCSFANLLAGVRKNHDEAERLYRRALEIEPDNAIVMAYFATFLSRVRKNYDEAERLHRRVLELEPESANGMANSAAFLLARGRISEAKDQAARAWPLCARQGVQAAAEVALYRGLMSRMEKKDDSAALGRLKTLLARGFGRGAWSFDDVLAEAANTLSGDDARLYAALAAAILDPGKVAELGEFPRWKALAPIALDTPWPEDD